MDAYFRDPGFQGIMQDEGERIGSHPGHLRIKAFKKNHMHLTVLSKEEKNR